MCYNEFNEYEIYELVCMTVNMVRHNTIIPSNKGTFPITYQLEDSHTFLYIVLFNLIKSV